MGKLPEIKKYNGIDTLFIDNAPFIILGGEIHNSSASDLAYMDKNHLAKLGWSESEYGYCTDLLGVN